MHFNFEFWHIPMFNFFACHTGNRNILVGYIVLLLHLFFGFIFVLFGL